jgi:chromosome segregation ATPase
MEEPPKVQARARGAGKITAKTKHERYADRNNKRKLATAALNEKPALLAEIEDLKNEIEDLKKEVFTLRISVDPLHAAEIKELKDTIHVMRTEGIFARAETQKRVAQLKSAELEQQAKGKSLDRHEVKLQEQSENLSSAMTQLKLLSGMKKEMEEAISEAKSAIQEVDDQFEAQAEELAAKVARVTFLRKELDAARALRKTSAAAEGETIQECIEQYEDEVASQEDELETAYSPICIRRVVDGEKQRQVDFNFYMADVKSMMIGATPEAVRKIQSYILEAAGVQMKEGWQDDQMKFRALRNLRLDAGDMVLIAAGIELAKAKRLLAIWVDETEKQLVPQLSQCDDHLLRQA